MSLRTSALSAHVELHALADPSRTLARMPGHFAVHQRDGRGGHLLARDLLGVHKLFFARRGDDIESASLLVDLLRAGHAIEDVYSVPAGHWVRIEPLTGRFESVAYEPLEFGAPANEFASNGAAPAVRLAACVAQVRDGLARVFALLRERCAGRPLHVTLSGGVDSTTIALLAAEHGLAPIAVTFAIDDGRVGAPGTDLASARRVAREFGLRHVEMVCPPNDVLDLLDTALVHGQDHRDFNVHCALVNAAIGKGLAELYPSGPSPVVVSGDTLNELFADYTSVVFRGHEYFGLPHVERGRLRRFLVGGLDAGDREAGVLAHFGVEGVQPYALCARALAALPADYIGRAQGKADLVRELIGVRAPSHVLERPKVRAQVAAEGEPSGTFALLLERGITRAHLSERFGQLLGIDGGSVANLVRTGRYRFATRMPEPGRLGASNGSASVGVDTRVQATSPHTARV